MKTILEIKNDVAFDFGYVDWTGFKRHMIVFGNEEQQEKPFSDFDKIVKEVAKRYSIQTEMFYISDEEIYD